MPSYVITAALTPTGMLNKSDLCHGAVLSQVLCKSEEVWAHLGSTVLFIRSVDPLCFIYIQSS